MLFALHGSLVLLAQQTRPRGPGRLLPSMALA